MKNLRMALLPVLALALTACADVQPVGPRALGADAADASKAQLKVDVCHHSEETNSYILISIAQAALPAHLAHGDGRPGDPVPGQPGWQFGPDCVPHFVRLDLTADALGYIDHFQGLVVDQFSVILPPPPVIVVSKSTERRPFIEDRGILEFLIAGIPGPVGHAELHLPILSMPITLFGLTLFSYTGDGIVSVGDFSGGFLTWNPFLGFPPPVNGTLTIDVTSAVNTLIAAHAAYVGFNLRLEFDGSITFSADASNLAHPTLSISNP